MKSTFIHLSSLSVLFITMCIASGCQNSQPSKQYATQRDGPLRNTDRARIWNARAIDLIGQADWVQAESSLQAALEADVTFGPAHNNLGRVYFQQNKFYQAAWEFQYASKLMPYSAEPRSNLGLVLEETGKLDEAVKHYDEALAIEPSNPQFLGNAARARVRRGDRDSRTQQLLSQVVSTDDRTEWTQWAKQQLILFKPVTPATQGQPLP